MFTADAVLLGFIGGVVGLILGTLLGRLVDWIGHLYLANEGVTGIGQMSIVPRLAGDWIADLCRPHWCIRGILPRRPGCPSRSGRGIEARIRIDHGFRLFR